MGKYCTRFVPNLLLIFSMNKSPYPICPNTTPVFPSSCSPCQLQAGQGRDSCLLFSAHKGPLFQPGPLGAAVMLIMLIFIILLVANLAQHLKLK